MATLVTLAEYKAYAGITGTAQDAQITVMLGLASSAIRVRCSRDPLTGFESLARTETYDGNGTDVLQLTEWPVSAVASVATLDNTGTSTTVDATTYRFTAATGVLAKVGAISGRFMGGINDSFVRINCAYGADVWGTSPNWPEGVQNVVVTYTGGYSPIPDGLKFACYMTIDTLLGDAGTGDFNSESIGDYSYTRGDRTSSEDAMARALAPFTVGVP